MPAMTQDLMTPQKQKLPDSSETGGDPLNSPLAHAPVSQLGPSMTDPRRKLRSTESGGAICRSRARPGPQAKAPGTDTPNSLSWI